MTVKFDRPLQAGISGEQGETQELWTRPQMEIALLGQGDGQI
jgi:hypothetical protein